MFRRSIIPESKPDARGTVADPLRKSANVEPDPATSPYRRISRRVHCRASRLGCRASRRGGEFARRMLRADRRRHAEPWRPPPRCLLATPSAPARNRHWRSSRNRDPGEAWSRRQVAHRPLPGECRRRAGTRARRNDLRPRPEQRPKRRRGARAFGLIAVRGTRFFAGPSDERLRRVCRTRDGDGRRGEHCGYGRSGMGTDIAHPGAEPTAPHPWGAARIASAMASVNQ